MCGNFAPETAEWDMAKGLDYITDNNQNNRNQNQNNNQVRMVTPFGRRES